MNRSCKSLLMIPVTLMLTSCLKTADQIKREQALDHLGQEVKTSQKQSVETSNAISELQKSISQLTGRIEELEHAVETEKTKNHQHEQAQEQTHQKQIDTLHSEIQTLKSSLEEQRAFIHQTTQTLEQFANKGAPQKNEHKEEKSLSNDDKLKSSTKLIKNKKYEEARAILFELLEEKKISGSKKDEVWQNLGLIELKRKNYEEALVYFTKIYPTSPKSGQAPSALLNIGKSLRGQGKKNEALMSFQELIKSYPESQVVSEAKKEIEELK